MSLRAHELVRSDCLEVLESRASLLSPLKGETLVVTGGTGFFGSWITEMVAALNDEFSFGTQLFLVSRSTDHFQAIRPHLANRKDVTLLKSDVRHIVEFPRDTTWLIHAAAIRDSRFHSTHPIETMSIIAEGTLSVLRAVDRCANLKMLLNLSSGLVYGPQPDSIERISENFSGAPQSGSVTSAYAEAKRYGETLVSAARSQARIPAVTVRPFSFLGPYQSIDTPWAVNCFIRDAMAGKPISVSGDGQTVRSYMYPSDLAFWLLRILTGGSSGEIYNVGSPQGVTLQSLAQLVSGHFQPNPDVRLRTSQGSVPRSVLLPEVKLALDKLGLSVQVPLEKALARTIQWNQLR